MKSEMMKSECKCGEKFLTKTPIAWEWFFCDCGNTVTVESYQNEENRRLLLGLTTLIGKFKEDFSVANVGYVKDYPVDENKDSWVRIIMLDKNTVVYLYQTDSMDHEFMIGTLEEAALFYQTLTL